MLLGEHECRRARCNAVELTGAATAMVAPGLRQLLYLSRYKRLPDAGLSHHPPPGKDEEASSEVHHLPQRCRVCYFVHYHRVLKLASQAHRYSV